MIIRRAAALVILSVLVSCSSSDSPKNSSGSTDAGSPGSEGSDCYGNGTCNQGLTCASKLCVKLGGGTGGTVGSGGNTGGAGVPVGSDGALPGTGGTNPAAGGGPGSGGLPVGSGGASPDSGAGGSGVDAGASTVIRIHYPAAGHTVTVRGSAPGLSWSLGQPTIRSGDAFTYSIAGLTAAAEWKPFLDDATSALGPSYHVAPGQTVDVWPHFTSTKGQVVTLVATFHSTVLANDRAVYAYLPASYTENTDATYPVVYMHDGQNLWAALPQLAFGAPWNVDTAFDTAANTGTCSANGIVGWGAQPLGGSPTTCASDSDCASRECRTFSEAIVIGVSNNANRIYEYTPTTDPGTPGGGGAGKYLQMLIEELKPTVDGLLRTRPDVASTAMAGSSLGGLFTAYAGWKRPDVFGLVAELSPATWWNSDVIVTDIETTPAAPARPRVVYVDSGQGSGDNQADTDLLASAYLGLGYVNGTTFRHVVQAGALHNETYWAERFPGAMQLLLGAR